MQRLQDLGFTIVDNQGYLNLGVGKWTEFFIGFDGIVDVYFRLNNEEPVEKEMTMDEYIQTVNLIKNSK